jgi:hypothetical protein
MARGKQKETDAPAEDPAVEETEAVDPKQVSQAIFDEGQAAGSGRDQIIVAMVQGGFTLNYAQNAYKLMAKEAGLETSRGGHKAEALQSLESADIAPEQFLLLETRQSLRKQLQDKFGVAESTANDYIKAYAVKHDIELPGGGGPTSEMAGHIFDFVMANQNCEKPAFKEFMEGHGRSKGNVDENWRGVLLARRLLTADYTYTPPVAADPEPETEEAA